MFSRRTKRVPNRRTFQSSDRSQRGIALISVLWVVTLLAILASSFVLDSRTKTNLARNTVANAQARVLANGGIYRGIALLRNRRQDDGFFLDGQTIGFSSSVGGLTITIQDEGGKIDLNGARGDLLAVLFEAFGLETADAISLVDAIADWRDSDKSRRARGAEDPDYLAAGLDYGSKDGRFDSVEELRQVLGMTDELYQQVSPSLTVYSGKRGIDLRVAPAPVLLALSRWDTDQVDEILEARKQSDSQLDISRFPEFASMRRFLSSSSRNVFTIRSVARIGENATFVREAVVRIARTKNRPFQILSWRRGDLNSTEPSA